MTNRQRKRRRSNVQFRNANRYLELIGIAPHRADHRRRPAAHGRYLPPQSGRQVSHLRVRRRRPGAVLGLRRHSQPRPGRVLRPRRLLHGDVPQARGLELGQHQDPIDAGHSRLHGLEPAARTAVLLAAVQIAALRPVRGHRGTDDRGVHRRHRDVQAAGRRRLLRDHHAGARRDDDHPDRRPARLYRRHQRHHRPAHAAGLGHPHRQRQIHPLFRLLRAAARHHVRWRASCSPASSAASWSPCATRRTACGSPATTSPTTRSSSSAWPRRWRRSAARCSRCRSASCRRPSSASCRRSRW